MKNKLLYKDPSYLDLLKSFAMRDALTAIGYYVIFMLVLYFTGYIASNNGKYLGAYASLILMLIPVMLCRKLSTIGINRRNLLKSLIVSSVIGILFLLVYTIIPGIMTHKKLLSTKKIVSNLVYYFAIIGLSEEIGFRGFIQPRLFPLVKKEWLMILIGGVLFVLMHYPFQMAARGMTLFEYWPLFIENAPFQFLWHIIFSLLYRRYGNIFGSTLLHCCVNMSEGIFE